MPDRGPDAQHIRNVGERPAPSEREQPSVPVEPEPHPDTHTPPADAGRTLGGGSLGHHQPPGVPEPPDPLPEQKE